MNALYGLKFIAFVFIFFHHLAFPHSMGSSFTTFFFVFAGFITAYNFSTKKFNPNFKNIINFYMKKFIKNYPIYLLTLVISIPYVTKVSGLTFTYKDLFTHMFMLQTIIPQGNKTFMFNGLSWFLVDLMFFYLIIPLIYKLLKKFKINSNLKYTYVIIMLFIVEFSFSILFINVTIKAYSYEWWLLYISPFSRLLNLLIGFVFGLLFTKNKELISLKYNKLPKYVIFIIEIATLFTIILRYKTSNLVPGVFVTNGFYDLPMSIILIIVFAISTGFISKILSTKTLVHLGKLSLSYYMLHQIIINYLVLCCFSSPWYNQGISYKRNLFNANFIFIIIICISEIFQKYILSPTNNFLINKCERKKSI